MVKNTRFVTDYDAVPRPVVAVGNEYPDDHEIEPHHHGRAQLLYGASGVMTVRTEHGAWVVPPAEGVWIPAGITHSVRMIGPVSTRSILVEPTAAADLPETCRVLSISPLMRELLLAAVETPLEYDPDGRDGLIMALLIQELRQLPILPLSLPFPTEPRLAQRCRRFLEAPDLHDTIDAWANALAMSRRTFTRFFKRETGMSFALWMRQACLFSALRRLGAGEAVTVVALDLGYDSPSAFTTMFRKALGVPPSKYLTSSSGRSR